MAYSRIEDKFVTFFVAFFFCPCGIIPDPAILPLGRRHNAHRGSGVPAALGNSEFQGISTSFPLRKVGVLLLL